MMLGFALVTAVIYTFLLFAPFRTGRWFYWLYVDCSNCLSDVIVDFAPLIALVVLFLWILVCIRKSKQFSCLTWLFILLLVFLLLFFALSVLPLESRHLDEVYVESKLWRLAYWDSGGSDGAYYQLFQCDILGITCDPVYSVSLYELNDKSSPNLIVDSQQHAIVIHNSSGDLYSHSYRE
jgi:hypothetical protein